MRALFKSKYTRESSLRKNYVPTIYQHVMEQMKSSIIFWFSEDETTDRCGHYIENLNVGILKKVTFLFGGLQRIKRN